MHLANTKAGLEREKRWGEALWTLGFNLIPVFGVLFWHWSLFGLFFLYWFESVVTGARTLLCILANAALQGPIKLLGALFTVTGLGMMYGGYFVAHGVFIVAMFGDGLPFPDAGFWAALWTIACAQAGLLSFGVFSIVFWQSVQFAGFILGGEVRTAKAAELMDAPYPRIILLHLAIIAGGFFIAALGRPVWGLVVLALFKTLYEIGPLFAPQLSAAPRGWTDARLAEDGAAGWRAPQG